MEKKDIGDQLSRARKEKKISLSQIAEETRINQDYLANIEQGVFTFLPKPYVLAYIKTYAQFVDIDSEALIEAWEKSETPTVVTEDDLNLDAPYQDEVRKLDEQAEQHQANKQSARPLSNFQTIKATHYKELAIGLGVIVVLLIIISIFSFGSDSSTDSPTTATTPAAEPTFDEIVAEQRAVLDSSAAPKTAQNETKTHPTASLTQGSGNVGAAPFSLALNAKGRVWLEISIDGGEMKEYLLQPDESMRWLIQSSVDLKTGNAGATVLTRDGQSLGALGDSGIVKRVYVARDSVRVY